MCGSSEFLCFFFIFILTIFCHNEENPINSIHKSILMATAQMARKKLFTADYEVHASIKMLYPYIQTASGLAEWFAENVNISPEKVFTFVWDNEEHKAIMAAHRTNHFARFEYLPESKADEKDPS